MEVQEQLPCYHAMHLHRLVRSRVPLMACRLGLLDCAGLASGGCRKANSLRSFSLITVAEETGGDGFAIRVIHVHIFTLSQQRTT